MAIQSDGTERDAAAGDEPSVPAAAGSDDGNAGSAPSDAGVAGAADGRDRPPRKERVLHTRVPAVLEQELKRLAGSLRVPVSNVVRTILEDAVDTIDSVGQLAEGELRGVADMLQRHRRRHRVAPEQAPASPAAHATAGAPAPLAGVVGYQELLLARREHCRLCGRAIDAGGPAFVGVREAATGPRVIVCRTCLPFSAAPRAAGSSSEEHDHD